MVKDRYPSGEMSERFKELVLKTSDSAMSRGFESHSLRHISLCFRFQKVNIFQNREANIFQNRKVNIHNYREVNIYN